MEWLAVFLLLVVPVLLGIRDARRGYTPPEPPPEPPTRVIWL